MGLPFEKVIHDVIGHPVGSSVRLDTSVLCRNVTSCVNSVFEDIDDVWQTKRKNALFASSKRVFSDVALFNLYFPRSKGKLRFPVFSTIAIKGARVSMDYIMIA